MLDIEKGTYSCIIDGETIIFIIDKMPHIFGRIHMANTEENVSIFIALEKFSAGPLLSNSNATPIVETQFESLFEFYKDVLEKDEELNNNLFE